MGAKIRDIIDYYAGHDVSDEIKERVLERVSGTQDDKEVNDVLRNLWNKADTAYMDEEEISAAYNRLLEADGAEEKTKAKQLHIFHFAKFAAIIIPLVMLIAFGKIYIDMSNDLDDMKLISMVQKHTTNDETQLIAMSDGTKVKLSQSSVLLYPSSFKGAKERKVFLSGEAFFDIKHDDNQPFHVSTAHFEITDLGTSFAVSSYTNADEVSTTLKTGKIELRIIGQEDKVYSMNPNDQLVYNVKTKAVKIQRVAKENDGLSWRNKVIDLNDVTLAEAARIMGNTYGVKFNFVSKRYQNTKVTIHFNRGETLKGAMSVIKNLVPGLEYEIKGDEVIVK